MPNNSQRTKTTGGTALPAETDPQLQPGDTDKPGDFEHPSDADGSPDAPPETPRLPGLPKLFFPPEPGPPQSFPPPGPQAGSGQPAGPTPGQFPGQPGSGQSGPGQFPGQPGPGQFPGQFPSQAGPGQPGPGRPVSGPSGRPARPTRTTPPDRELRHRGLAAIAIGILSLIALLGVKQDLSRSIYLVIFSAIIGVAATVIGITALRKARRAGSRRPRGAIGGIITGSFAALIALAWIAVYAAYPAQVSRFVTCIGQAQTQSDQQACLNQFLNSTRR